MRNKKPKKKSRIDKWLAVCVSHFKTGELGNCPFCNGSNLDIGYCIVRDYGDEKLGFGDVWCNDCKQAFHISRCEIYDGMPLKLAPKGLNYGGYRG